MLPLAAAVLIRCPIDCKVWLTRAQPAGAPPAAALLVEVVATVVLVVVVVLELELDPPHAASPSPSSPSPSSEVRTPSRTVFPFFRRNAPGL